MKTIQGTDRPQPRRPDDWDDDDCLCHGEVPEEKKVFFQEKRWHEKKKQNIWRNVLRCHIDCPIHGVRITTEDRPCREA